MPELLEITEPMELVNQTAVYFRSKRGEYRYFYFVVDKPCVVKINTWPLDEESDPDLYVGIDGETESVDCSKSLFKSNNIGADQIVVYPDDPKFKLGVWRISIHAFNNSE